MYWIVSSFSEGDIENCYRLFSVLPFFSFIVPIAYNNVVVLDSHNRTQRRKEMSSVLTKSSAVKLTHTRAKKIIKRKDGLN